MKNIIQSLKVVALGLMLAIGLSYAFAWTAPTGNPPSGNVSAPVNVGGNLQTKAGDLWSDNFLGSQGGGYFGGDLEVENGKGITLGGVYMTDWPSGGGISGSGSSNYISKWTSGSSLGNSQIFDNGTNVGIGTASPTTKFQVEGQIRATGGTPIYSCPVKRIFCGGAGITSGTCAGQLTTSSTCIEAYYAEAGGLCMTATHACTLVGRLVAP